MFVTKYFPPSVITKAVCHLVPFYLSDLIPSLSLPPSSLLVLQNLRLFLPGILPHGSFLLFIQVSVLTTPERPSLTTGISEHINPTPNFYALMYLNFFHSITCHNIYLFAYLLPILVVCQKVSQLGFGMTSSKSRMGLAHRRHSGLHF